MSEVMADPMLDYENTLISLVHESHGIILIKKDIPEWN